MQPFSEDGNVFLSRLFKKIQVPNELTHDKLSVELCHKHLENHEERRYKTSKTCHQSKNVVYASGVICNLSWKEEVGAEHDKWCLVVECLSVVSWSLHCVIARFWNPGVVHSVVKVSVLPRPLQNIDSFLLVCHMVDSDEIVVVHVLIKLRLELGVKLIHGGYGLSIILCEFDSFMENKHCQVYSVQEFYDFRVFFAIWVDLFVAL